MTLAPPVVQAAQDPRRLRIGVEVDPTCSHGAYTQYIAYYSARIGRANR